MKKIENFDEMKEKGSEDVSFQSVPAGPQICKIIDVEDVEDKEYLKIQFDVCDGDLKGVFQEQYDKFGEWPASGTTYRSYKHSAYAFFTAFVIAVEKSNKNFVWNWDEKELINKKIVVNFGEEEYINDSGETKTSMKAREIRSIVSLNEGALKVPELKKAKKTETTKRREAPVNKVPTLEVSEDDLPF